MDMRQRVAMRRLVDVTMDQVRLGAVQPAEAAQALQGAGVPFNVIGRVVGQAMQARAVAVPRETPHAAQPARATMSLGWSAA